MIPTKTVETYSCGKDRDLASMEVRAVVSEHEIGRACGRPHPTIRKLLLPCGGVQLPTLARRSRLALLDS